MRLEHLYYLCEIAKRKSMNLAASKLFVSQQTLSTAIKNLENELDTKLLERTYHGVFPTEIGQELIDISQQMLSQLDQLKLKIAAQNNKQLTGEITVAIEHGINTLIAPKIVSNFYKYYPEIHIQITPLSRSEISETIRDKKYDIGIISHYEHSPLDVTIEPSEELIKKEIIDFQLLARVNRRSPLATESSISLRTLLNYPLALNDSSSGADLLTELRKYGTTNILLTHNYATAQQLVCDNLAVSFAVKVNNYLPYYFNDFNGEIVHIPIKEPFPFNASYIIHEDNAESPLIQNFIDALIKIT
jgi:DNA-binding transcriptional LysR family regulator